LIALAGLLAAQTDGDYRSSAVLDHTRLLWVTRWGNFPTFLANDGSLIDPKNLPKEVRDIDSGETWLLNRVGRQYTRTMSRQIYAYCVAYHMTGTNNTCDTPKQA